MGMKKYILQLLNKHSRDTFMKDILISVADDDIKFDQNPYLFAFNNKIYDLKLGQFIDPKPELYVSLTTGYNWNDKDENHQKLIHEIIDTIFPQAELKELYMTILSSGLDGIPLEKFVLANGGGGNGKGLLNELTQFMLGKSAYVLPANVLVGPMKTGNCPEIANMNNKRLVFVREPNPDLKFNCATIKELTGGGEINARLNYSSDCTTNLNRTLILK